MSDLSRDDTLIDIRLREPLVEEREAGYHAARLADQEAVKKPNVRERCWDCAFRFGTDPNTSGATILNAMKCVLERDPFFCHHAGENGDLPICAGWALLVDPGAEPRETPWPFIAGADPAKTEKNDG